MRIVSMMSLLTAVVLAASGCASGTSAGPMDPAAASVDIRVEPETTQAELGGTVTFRATVTGSALTEVSWSANCGSITPAGVYAAPRSAGVCRVTATAAGGAIVGHALVSVGGWAASCAAEPEPTVNVVYVCDCQPGADANCVAGNDTTGKGSKAEPYLTWDKVRTTFRTMAGGSTIAMCKGGSWITSSWSYSDWRNASCTDNAPCTLRDYAPGWGSGDESAPRISFDMAVPDMHIIQMGTGTQHVRILNLSFKDLAPGTSHGAMVFSYGKAHDVEFCNNTFDGGGIHMQVRDTAATAVCNSYNWKIRGNRFLNSCLDAMLISVRDMDVDGNFFDNNGNNLCGGYAMEDPPGSGNGWPWGPTTHTFYASGELCPIDNLTFRNNEVRRNAMYNGYSQGSPVKIRDQGNDILLENNVVDFSPPHPTIAGTVGAITADNNGDLTKAGFDRMVIRRNRIIGGLGNKIAVSAASNLLIEDNVILETAPAFEGHHSTIKLSHKGATESRRTAGTIRNNTIYITGSGPTISDAEFFEAISLAHPTSGSGNVVTGNSITITGAAPQGSCFRIADPAKVSFMNNNQCSGDIGFATTADEFTDMPLSAWKAAYPQFDSASITPSVTGLFVNAPTDLTPAAGSPLLNAASQERCTINGVMDKPCSSPVAVESPAWNPLGTAMPRESAPDIGAMEK